MFFKIIVLEDLDKLNINSDVDSIFRTVFAVFRTENAATLDICFKKAYNTREYDSESNENYRNIIFGGAANERIY